MIFDKLSEKDQKTLKFGALLMVIIIAVGSMNLLLDEYKKTSKKLRDAESKFALIKPRSDGSPTLKQSSYYKTVPVFQPPKDEDIPGENFRQLFIQQLRKQKIQFPVLNLMPISGKKKAGGLRTRNVQCKGRCTFNQAMDMIAGLYENPWFVGIEEFKISCDPKNRSQMDFTITVSSIIK